MTLVEIDGSSVRDQRKIIFPVLGLLTLFFKKILPSFPSFFLLSQSKCRPGNLWSVTSRPGCVSLPRDTVCHQFLLPSLLGDRTLFLEVWIRGRESGAWMKLIVFSQIGAKFLKAHLFFAFLPVILKVF